MPTVYDFLNFHNNFVQSYKFYECVSLFIICKKSYLENCVTLRQKKNIINNMGTVITILFPNSIESRRINVALLALRLLFGILFMVHGLSKLNDFSQISSSFPDPFGIGSEAYLILAIFSEVGCSIMLILGLLTRLALIPMVFTMCIAFFVIHSGDPFSAKESAFTFLLTFMILWISGAGKYSLDYIIRNKIRTRC